MTRPANPRFLRVCFMARVRTALNGIFMNAATSMASARAKVDAFFDGGGYTGEQTGGFSIAVLTSSLAVFDATLTDAQEPEPFLLYKQWGKYCYCPANPNGSPWIYCHCQQNGPGPTYAEFVPTPFDGGGSVSVEYGIISTFSPTGDGDWGRTSVTDVWMGHANPNVPAKDKFWIVKFIKGTKGDERQILEARPYTHGVPWD